MQRTGWCLQALLLDGKPLQVPQAAAIAALDDVEYLNSTLKLNEEQMVKIEKELNITENNLPFSTLSAPSSAGLNPKQPTKPTASHKFKLPLFSISSKSGTNSFDLIGTLD